MSPFPPPSQPPVPPSPPPPPPPPGAWAVAPPAAITPVGHTARTMQILLVANLAVAVLSLPVSLETARRARRFLADERALDNFRTASNTQSTLGMLSGGLTIAIAVFTMIWMFRIARNHEIAGRSGATWSPGWAIGGWFCPPMLYVIPMLMFRELWRASSPEVPATEPAWRSAPVSPLPIVWLVLYGIAPVAGMAVSFRHLSWDALTGFDDRNMARLLDVAPALTIATSVLGMGAAAAYLLLVRQLTARHLQLVGTT